MGTVFITGAEMIRFNIIGAGKLGKTFARLLADLPNYRLLSVCNRTIESSELACDDIGAGEPTDLISALPHADLFLICTSDGEIASVVSELCKHQDLAGSIVVHFSGALNSEVLAPLREKGAYVASVHPMRSFSNAEISHSQFFGTKCALEGDREARKMMTIALEDLGATFFLIDKTKKALYHSAGVFASNYMIGLANAAEQCLVGAGITDRALQKDIVSSLMAGTLENYRRTESTAEALTGPVARGDAATINLHLQAFSSEHHQLSSFYRKLACFLVENVAHLAESKKEELATLLNCQKEQEVKSKRPEYSLTP